MRNTIFAILLMLLICVALCFYYSKEGRQKEKKIFKKFKNMFLLKKGEYIMLFITALACFGTFVIGQFIYNAELLMTFRWQIAIGIIIPIAVIDFKEQIIPNKLLLIGLLFAVPMIGIQVFFNNEFIVNILGTATMGAIVAGGIFFIASIIMKDGIGAGDIKMFLFLGFLLAFRGIFNVLLYSMVISAIISIILLISKKKKVKDVMPLAPFTLVGVILSILLGV